MHLIDDQYWAFFDAVSKTLTASIYIEKVKVHNFRCVINLYNPTNTSFDLLYVVRDMDFCDFLVPFDQEGNPLQETVEFNGKLFFTISGQKSLPNFRDWEAVQIIAGGVQYFEIPNFEIPMWLEQRSVEGNPAKLLHVGDTKMFWIGEATKIDMLFGYYRLESEFVPFPIDL